MIWTAVLLFAQAAAPPSLGPQIFATTCAVGYCHGAAGAANRGPRLRGRDFERTFVERVVRTGVPNTAMPGFEGRLKAPELNAVIDYVMSISGTKGAPAPGPAAVPAIGETASKTAPSVSPARSHGEELFFDATREVRCGTCHQVGKGGINVAGLQPGAALPAQPKNVKRISLKDGDNFPALIAGDTGGLIRAWDLTVPPPVLRTISRDQIASMGNETSWKHSDVTKNYSPEELDEAMRFAMSGAR